MGGRRLALIALLACAAACGPTRVALPSAGAARLVVVGSAVIARPVSTDSRSDVGGISGAYYDPSRGVLYTVSDDRDRPRVVSFDVRLVPRVALAMRRVVPLQLPPGNAMDAEGIAPAPDDRFFVASEADTSAPVVGIHEYTREGRFVRSLPLPPAFRDVSARSGPRDNLSLEGVSRSPDGQDLFVSMESSLRQDGPVADFDRGALVRLLVYNVRHLDAQPREYAYRTDPISRPAAYPVARRELGVSDVLALSDTDALVLERGFVMEAAAAAPRVSNSIRIYRTHLDPAAEVTGRLSIDQQPPAAVLAKTLVLDMANVAPDLVERLRGLENFEAMTFGPRLPDGTPTLMLISDDNFSPRQVTGVVVFRWQ